MQSPRKGPDYNWLWDGHVSWRLAAQAAPVVEPGKHLRLGELIQTSLNESLAMKAVGVARNQPAENAEVA